MAGGRGEVASAFRLLWTDERRLLGGAGLGLVLYALWVGVTGAGLTFGADALNVSLQPRPWTGAKTALVAAGLLVGALTNADGNLAQPYRYRHPAALLVPPGVALALAAAAVLAMGGSLPALVALVAAALLSVVRVVAYGYRAFSLSLPRALFGVAAATAAALAVALLVAGGTIAGRGAYLRAVATAFGDAVGVTGLRALVGGTVTVAGTTLPAAVALVVGVVVGLSGAYLAAQTLAAVVARVRKPEVRRPALRTGQRYPAFAHPTADRQPADRRAGGPQTDGTDGATFPSADGRGMGAAGGAAPSDEQTGTPEATAETGGAGGEAEAGDDSEPGLTDTVGDTRVYTPPEDAEVGAGGMAAPGERRSGADDGSGGGTPGSVVCPACNEVCDANTDFCPTCGTALD